MCVHVCVCHRRRGHDEGSIYNNIFCFPKPFRLVSWCIISRGKQSPRPAEFRWIIVGKTHATWRQTKIALSHLLRPTFTGIWLQSVKDRGKLRLQVSKATSYLIMTNSITERLFPSIPRCISSLPFYQFFISQIIHLTICSSNTGRNFTSCISQRKINQ